MFYTKIIENLRKETDTIILFHSATGKDSIMLLDVLSKRFTKVFCVFMYIVKDLDYENCYIEWAQKKYSNCEFIKTPHYCLNSFIKHGYLGIAKDETVKNKIPATLHAQIKKLLQQDWLVFGFKKIDGITRRSFLNKAYQNGININTKKGFPLMDLKNSDVLKYISDNNLIEPFNYGTNKPSSGCDISTPEFLFYIAQKYPFDLKKIYEQFPFTEINLFKYLAYYESQTE